MDAVYMGKSEQSRPEEELSNKLSYSQRKQQQGKGEIDRAMERSPTTEQQQQQQGRRRGAGWRRWAVLVATVWIQAVTGTNFDFSAYSSALKASLGVSQEALNYLATASDLGKALGWSSGLALIHLPLPAVLLLSAASGLAAYALQYALILDYLHLPYPLQ
uniref:Nodulin-like domain-containing protein n=1 Tax=Oryza barthii TaxID=65489 RepID=A0A0D3HH90_9ORYZ